MFKQKQPALSHIQTLHSPPTSPFCRSPCARRGSRWVARPLPLPPEWCREWKVWNTPTRPACCWGCRCGQAPCREARLCNPIPGRRLPRVFGVAGAAGAGCRFHRLFGLLGPHAVTLNPTLNPSTEVGHLPRTSDPGMCSLGWLGQRAAYLWHTFVCLSVYA